MESSVQSMLLRMPNTIALIVSEVIAEAVVGNQKAKTPRGLFVSQQQSQEASATTHHQEDQLTQSANINFVWQNAIEAWKWQNAIQGGKPHPKNSK
eukprot:5766348-Amphidinium_carterae.1